MAFLLFGTAWFWLLFGGAAILIIWFLESALDFEHDRGSGGGLFSTLTIIACLTLYWFFGSSEDIKTLFMYLRDNPARSLLWIGSYIALGLVWSIFKWYFYLYNKNEYLTKKFENDSLYESDFPKAKNNKARIISWMSYWPFSALWTLINEPVKKTYRFIYSKMERLFVAMENKILGELKAKFKAKQEEKRK